MNIDKINQSVSKKHQEFLSLYSAQIDKLGTDHRLRTQIFLTKLISVLQPFVDNKVIDEPVVLNESAFSQIILRKKDLLGEVHLITDGKILIVKEHNIKIHIGLQIALAKEYDCSEELDWEVFSIDLLDIIHSVIYGRKEAATLRIFGSLV